MSFSVRGLFSKLVNHVESMPPCIHYHTWFTNSNNSNFNFIKFRACYDLE